jgi:hypothetical protein
VTEFEALLDEVNLAPSVHNVQPGRWRAVEGAYELHLDKSRLLPAADPTHRDVILSLGAALEGMRLALARRGKSSSVEVFGFDKEPVAKVYVENFSQDVSDRLINVVDARQTYRGVFASAPEVVVKRFQEALSSSSVAVIIDKAMINEAASLYDVANLQFLRDPKFLAELNQWLRLTKLHKRFSKDGLNYEAMGLDPVSAAAAAGVLRPEIFKNLDRVGAAEKFVSEAEANRSSSAIVVLTREDGDDYFVTGVKLYQLWLKATLAGFSLAPISSLTDYAPTRNKLRAMAGIDVNKEIILAFRAGPTPAKRYPRARRDFSEVSL